MLIILLIPPLYRVQTCFRPRPYSHKMDGFRTVRWHCARISQTWYKHDARSVFMNHPYEIGCLLFCTLVAVFQSSWFSFYIRCLVGWHPEVIMDSPGPSWHGSYIRRSPSPYMCSCRSVVTEISSIYVAKRRSTVVLEETGSRAWL